ncbi:SKP1-like protein 1A [Olea europaea var. sylvestris]|uniref:SKP1-like protein 1A n=1 Tax=Olea europaea var. sylvestris TaxID=158386 RepID=UPI000C1D7AB5|nr:SKP1-like protein 1A [Olea europaea var. sylvestris]
MSSSEERKLILKSSDNEEFVVKESSAVQCLTIKNLVEDRCVSDPIPLANVDSKILALVIEFMEKHAETTLSNSEKKEFDVEFVKKPFDDLLELILAANYLDFRELMDVLCNTCAKQMENWSVEEVREKFNIQNDYTVEEEKAARAENPWAFE